MSTLQAATTLAHLVMGAAYLLAGTMVLIDARRQRGAFGTALAIALVAMAYTCGPHHVEHAIHLAADVGRTAGALDLLTVLVGIPPGAAFCLLAYEAVRGGSGDRLIPGTPRWLMWIALAFAVYVTALLAAAVSALPDLRGWDAVMVPNILLVAIYAAVAIVILRTQVARRPLTGSWSLQGLSLGAIFPTCAAMHAVWVLYGAVGRYEADWHLLAIDWASVPAGILFLVVAERLRREAIDEWTDVDAGVLAGVGR